MSSSNKRSTTTATPASERGKRTGWLSETTSRAIARVKNDAAEADGFDPGARVSVNKAYKMYVGGAFVRSESGRYFQVRGSDAEGSADPSVVNVPRGSRKDARDAVLAAKNAADSWAARTAYNRGQILYRLAEVMESRRDELRVALVRGGLDEAKAAREVELSIDRAVYYAGFCDKFQSLVASHNPVAGPHFGFSLPEPMGVVAVVAPQRPALLGLVSTALPVIAGGNTSVVLASSEDPRSARLVRMPGDERPARRCGQHPHRAGERDRAPPREAPRSCCHGRLERRRRSARRRRARGQRERQARAHARRGGDGGALRGHRSGARLHRALPRDEDCVAPRRGVGALQPAAAAIASSSVKSPS